MGEGGGEAAASILAPAGRQLASHWHQLKKTKIRWLPWGESADVLQDAMWAQIGTKCCSHLLPTSVNATLPGNCVGSFSVLSNSQDP